MTGGLNLLDMTVFAGPTDLPAVHLADAPGTVFAKKGGKLFVAEAAPGGQRIGEMMLPMIRRLFAERGSNRHLRHDRGAATADQASVGEDHIDAGSRGLKRRIHPCPACPDHEYIGLKRRRHFHRHVAILLRSIFKAEPKPAHLRKHFKIKAQIAVAWRMQKRGCPLGSLSNSS